MKLPGSKVRRSSSCFDIRFFHTNITSIVAEKDEKMTYLNRKRKIIKSKKLIPNYGGVFTEKNC